MEIGPLSPSPPWGEGWGEGATHQTAHNGKISTTLLPIP
ncbi:hypothetical protein QF010_003072 [Pseudomonas silensiensis]